MWDRKAIKHSAKANIKMNYVAAIAVCFIIAFLAGGYSFSSNSISELYPGGLNPSQFIQSTIGGDGYGENALPYRGVIGMAVNMFTDPSSTGNRVVHTVKSFVDGNAIVNQVFGIISVAVTLLLYFFVRNILKIGEKRFFLENRLYHDTRITRIAFIYKKKRTIRSAWTMFVKDVFLGLWMLTIVGGVINFYSYRLIPYIIAENPDISRKNAILLSRGMMKGYKFEMFKLDVSFLWWYLLSVFSIGLVGFFWLNPYIASTNAEIYMMLRANAIYNKIPCYESLNDEYLAHKPDNSLDNEEVRENV